MKKRLCKSSQGKKIFGVCAGIAEYLDVDPVLIRILWVIALFVFGTGVLAYIIAACLMPYDTDLKNDNGKYEYVQKN